MALNLTRINLTKLTAFRLAAPPVQRRLIKPRDRPRSVNWRELNEGRNIERARSSMIKEMRALEDEQMSSGRKATLTILRAISWVVAIGIMGTVGYSFIKISRSGGVSEYRKAQLTPSRPTIDV